LAEYEDNLPIVRNELRKLFPDKLEVRSKALKDTVEVRVKGRMNPFNLVAPPGLYESIIAVQGIEPTINYGSILWRFKQ